MKIRTTTENNKVKRKKKKRKHIRRLIKGLFRLIRTLILAANVVLVLRAVQILVELKEKNSGYGT